MVRSRSPVRFWPLAPQILFERSEIQNLVPRQRRGRAMYFVYILRSKKTGRYYIGYTRDIEMRLRDHNRGKTKSLVRHIPLEIIRVEEYSAREDAMERERQIKRFKSGAAFKKLLE